jgi:hypothetical protein
MKSIRCKSVHQLDVMLVNGKVFRPTWINIPSLKNTRIEELQVTFRIFGVVEHRGVMSGSTGDFNHQLAWSLYYLLWDFLRRGPTMRLFDEQKTAVKQCSKKGKKTAWEEEKDQDKKTTVKYLHINVEIAPLTDGEELIPADTPVCQGGKPDGQKQPHRAPYVTQARALAELIALGLDGLFGQGSLPDRYIFFERIRDIEIGVEGESFRKWDLGKILEKVSGHARHYPTYQTLKRRLFHARFKNGLQSRAKFSWRKG